MKNKDDIITIGNLEHTFNLLRSRKINKTKNSININTQENKNNRQNGDIPPWLTELNLLSSGSSNSSSSNSSSRNSSCDSSCSS